MKNSTTTNKFPLPKDKIWTRLPDRVQVLEDSKVSPTYKVYTALVTQSGTNPPTSTILSNDTTLTFTWSYVDVGIFDINISSAIDLNKVLVLSSIQFYNGPGTTILLIFEQNSSTTTKLRFKCSQLAGSGIFNNGLLLNHGLEIRVYN